MLEIKKINNTNTNFIVQGQGCLDDCIEHNIWVGRTNGNTPGCVLYDTAYTPKTSTWF